MDILNAIHTNVRECSQKETIIFCHPFGTIHFYAIQTDPQVHFKQYIRYLCRNVKAASRYMPEPMYACMGECAMHTQCQFTVFGGVLEYVQICTYVHIEKCVRFKGGVSEMLLRGRVGAIVVCWHFRIFVMKPSKSNVFGLGPVPMKQKRRRF